MIYKIISHRVIKKQIKLKEISSNIMNIKLIQLKRLIGRLMEIREEGQWVWEMIRIILMRYQLMIGKN